MKRSEALHYAAHAGFAFSTLTFVGSGVGFAVRDGFLELENLPAIVRPVAKHLASNNETLGDIPRPEAMALAGTVLAGVSFIVRDKSINFRKGGE